MRPVRVSVRSSRRMTLGLLWVASILLAGALGWAVGRFGTGDELWTAWAGALESSSPAGAVESSVPQLPPIRPAVDPRPVTPAPVETTPPPIENAPRREPEPEPIPEPAIEEPVLEEPEPLPAEPLPTAWERAREAQALSGTAATDEAAALLAEHVTYSDLAAALQTDGAGEIDARLTALRMLDLAGHDAISRDVARELRRGYAGSPEVAEKIRDWGILKPQIDSVESSVANGRFLTVSGRVDNPDIVRVRRLKVRVEALDGAGSVLASEEVRVRPKLLEPGEAGEFSAEFKGLDPALVLRTRTTVVAWESAIAGS